MPPAINTLVSLNDRPCRCQQRWPAPMTRKVSASITQRYWILEPRVRWISMFGSVFDVPFQAKLNPACSSSLFSAEAVHNGRASSHLPFAVCQFAAARLRHRGRIFRWKHSNGGELEDVTLDARLRFIDADGYGVHRHSTSNHAAGKGADIAFTRSPRALRPMRAIRIPERLVTKDLFIHSARTVTSRSRLIHFCQHLIVKVQREGD